jgi:putative transposase
MKNLTVSKTKSGKYFISIGCVVETDEPRCEGVQIGIDLGLIDFISSLRPTVKPSPRRAISGRREENRLIGFENLNVAGMLKNHRLAKSIQDAGWGEFVRQATYKGAWYGCHIEKVGRFFPSSRLCSVCGEKHQSLRLSGRKWVCVGCGAVHKRGENAAKNILKEATGGAPERYVGGERVRPGWGIPVPAVSLKPEAQLL